MQIKTQIINSVVVLTEPNVPERYVIDLNNQTGKFYIRTDNGGSTEGLLEFACLSKAVKCAVNSIKHYFTDRCEEPPKGF